MSKYIFLGVFLVASLLQGVRWHAFSIVDASVWARQAEYVQNGDVRRFDFGAYAYPGATVIDGVILTRGVFGISYDKSLILFLTFFNGFIIACISTLCFILRPKNLWWLAASGMLSLDRMYAYATPTSAVISPLVVLLCLLTLHLYKSGAAAKGRNLIFWITTAGLLIATRFDIGSVFVGVLLGFLLFKIGRKKAVFAGVAVFLIFSAINPYMWFAPFRHLFDLISNVTYHYAEYPPSRMTLLDVLDISFLAIICMVLSVIFLIFPKKLSLPSPLYAGFLSTLFVVTVLLYAVFLTANIQAPRYFLPLIFIWQVLLPLFLFTLISKMRFHFIKTQKKRIRARFFGEVFVVIILIGLPAAAFLNNLWIHFSLSPVFDLF